MSKIVLFTGIAGIVGGTLYMAEPLKAGEVYPLPANKALSLVENVQFPKQLDKLLTQAGAGNNPVQRAIVPGKSVLFTFKVKGKEVGTYTVTVDPVDAESSRVATNFEMASDSEENMQGEFMPMRKSFGLIGKAILEESVDAALDDRPYDGEPARLAAQAYVVTNMGEIHGAASASMEKAAKKFEDADRQLSPRYNYGSGQTPRFAPGKPMMDAKPSASR